MLNDLYTCFDSIIGNFKVYKVEFSILREKIILTAKIHYYIRFWISDYSILQKKKTVHRSEGIDK